MRARRCAQAQVRRAWNGAWPRKCRLMPGSASKALMLREWTARLGSEWKAIGKRRCFPLQEVVFTVLRNLILGAVPEQVFTFCDFFAQLLYLPIYLLSSLLKY